MKAYLVAFDPYFTNMQQAHIAITSVPGSEWWHYLNGIYIITSDLSLDDVRENLLSRWPGSYILITELKSRADGLLPADAWNWINTRIP